LATSFRSGLGSGFLKGCRRNEKKVFFSAGSALLRTDPFGSRVECTLFGRASLGLKCDEAGAAFEPRELDSCEIDPLEPEPCELDPPELCELEPFETDPIELCPPPELPEELEPPEELA
jgi:hypothetical protein